MLARVSRALFLLVAGAAVALCAEDADASFSCEGRASGYYADVDSGCQVYHMCDGLGRQFSYHCPNTTLFQQRMLICDHWYMVNCSKSERDYSANLLIGQRDKPFVDDSVEHPYHRTPRPDLLTHPYAPDFQDGYRQARAQSKPIKNLVGVATNYTTDRPVYFLPSHWSTLYSKDGTTPLPPAKKTYNYVPFSKNPVIGDDKPSQPFHFDPKRYKITKVSKPLENLTEGRKKSVSNTPRSTLVTSASGLGLTGQNRRPYTTTTQPPQSNKPSLNPLPTSGFVNGRLTPSSRFGSLNPSTLSGVDSSKTSLPGRTDTGNPTVGFGSSNPSPTRSADTTTSNVFGSQPTPFSSRGTTGGVGSNPLPSRGTDDGRPNPVRTPGRFIPQQKTLQGSQADRRSDVVAPSLDLEPPRLGIGGGFGTPSATRKSGEGDGSQFGEGLANSNENDGIPNTSDPISKPNDTIPSPSIYYQPPKRAFSVASETSTMDPRAFYRLLPSKDLEPPQPKPGNPEAPKSATADSKPADGSDDYNPSLAILSNERLSPERKWKELRQMFFIPEYDFPLEVVARPAYESGVSSFQVKAAPRLGSDAEGKLTPNPKCPRCDPAFLEAGSCSPCVVVR